MNLLRTPRGVPLLRGAMALGMLALAAAVPSEARATGTCAPDARSGHPQTACSPDLKVEKTGPASVKLGETVTYTVVVSNVGDVRVSRRVVRVTDPALTDDALDFHAVMSGDDDAWLEPGEAWEYRLAGDRPITATPDSCDIVTNKAYVAPLRHETKLRNNRSKVVTKVICVRDLAIAKVSDKATYAPGETITYTITVTNSGQLPIPFGAIVVSDPSLPSLTLVGEPPAVLMPGGTLEYGGSRTATTQDCGTIANTATVGLIHSVVKTHPTDPGEETSVNNTASATVSVVCTPGIAITKSADRQSYEPGQAIKYTVVVTNTGQTTIPFDQIQVNDLAAILTILGAAPVSVAPGDTVTYTGTRATFASDCGPVVNTARVTIVPDPAQVIQPSPLTASASVTVQVAGAACQVTVTGLPSVVSILSITKSGPVIGRARKAFVHTIRVTNTGPVTATGVVVEDPVPSGLAVVRTPVGATFVHGTVRWELGNLTPGATRTLRVSLKTTFRVTARRCNVATADADNAAPVTSRLCTKFLAVAGQQFGGVTG